MLSALIPSKLSYPAMPRAGQLADQRFIHPDPLVQWTTPLKYRRLRQIGTNLSYAYISSVTRSMDYTISSYNLSYYEEPTCHLPSFYPEDLIACTIKSLRGPQYCRLPSVLSYHLTGWISDRNSPIWVDFAILLSEKSRHFDGLNPARVPF